MTDYSVTHTDYNNKITMSRLCTGIDEVLPIVKEGLEKGWGIVKVEKIPEEDEEDND